MSLVHVLQRLEALDPAALERSGITLAALDARDLRRFVDGIEVMLAGRLADLDQPAADALRELGHASTHAASVERAAQTVGDVPELGAALSARRLGLEHVHAYRRVERTLSPEQRARLRERVPELLEMTWSTPEQFARRVNAVARALRTDDGEHAAEQQRNDRSVQWGYRRDGMGFLRGCFDPETASRLFSMLAAQRESLAKAVPGLTIEQAGADALTDLMLGVGRATHPGRTEVVVLIDLESLLHGAHAGGVSYLSNGAHIPVASVRRLCCEAAIIPMVLGGDGMPLDVGREARLANRAQRRALRKLYRSCAHPGCEVRFDDCRVHHVDWWEHLGPTDLRNLLPLCGRHHHLVHEGGWRLTIDAHRTITLRRPDGTLHRTVFWKPPAGEQPGFRRRPHEPDREAARPRVAA